LNKRDLTVSFSDNESEEEEEEEDWNNFMSDASSDGDKRDSYESDKEESVALEEEFAKVSVGKHDSNNS